MTDIMTSGAGSAPAEPPLADFRLSYRASLISPVVVSGSMRVAEAAFIGAIGYAIYMLYVQTVDPAANWRYGSASLTATFGASLVFHLLGLYSIPRLGTFGPNLARQAFGWTLVFAGVAAGIFFLKAGPDFSRVWLLGWYLTGAAGLVAIRGTASILVRYWIRQGRLMRRAVIVGTGPATESLIHAMEQERESDVRICGLFDDRGAERAKQVTAGYPLLGNLDELVAFGRRTRVDLLIVSLPLTAENRLLQVLRKLWVLPVDIRLAAHTSKLRFAPRAYSYIGALPFIDLADRPLADWNTVQKWLFDRVIGILALIVVSPLMLATAIAIKLGSRGPVLFRQKRYGFNNELIEVWKFRSMYVEQSDRDAVKLVTKDDPRVTQVGRCIRKTSLDELPQLFNVLSGQLSLVGPRPHALQAKAADQLYQDVVDGYFARHRVKPGVTGWAQINGWRGETDTAEKIQKRVEHDLYYIENWSVLFDLYILLRTPFALLKADNAY